MAGTPRHLFAYGTLRFAPVMRAVGGRLPRASEATLADHACYLARHGRFPGLVPAAGESTGGRLWLDVDATLLRRLDRFEGELYARQALSVRSGGRSEPAWVYVLAPAHRSLLGESRFDAERFERERLPEWLARLGVRRR